MAARPQLVLDMAGVLIENFSAACWRELSERAETTFEEFAACFQEIRADLWTGKMTEERFWDWASLRYPVLERTRGREIVHRNLKPLPGFRNLERWGSLADIHVLSNHCQEWLAPLLPRLEPLTRSLTISNRTGYRKPDPRIYELAAERFGANAGETLYVDDQEKNLFPARELGWETLLADAAGEWMGRVDEWLTNAQTRAEREETTWR